MICEPCQTMFEEVADRVRAADVFDKVRCGDDALMCRARPNSSDASYFAEVPEPHNLVWVGLLTSDRWLNESIEAALMDQGDDIQELLEDELIDQGFDGRLPVEHFRDNEKQYLFRSPVSLPNGEKLDEEPMIIRVSKVLLAYEAAFNQLGDLRAGQDES